MKRFEPMFRRNAEWVSPEIEDGAIRIRDPEVHAMNMDHHDSILMVVAGVHESWNDLHDLESTRPASRH